MNNTSSYLRGDLRIASFLLAAVTTLGGTAQAITAEAQGAPAYTVKVAVSTAGFEPKRISVPLGTVHFVVSAAEGDHCFAIPSLDVEKRVRASRPLEVDVTFERVGEFPFLCCVESSGTAETGVIVVTQGK